MNASIQRWFAVVLLLASAIALLWGWRTQVMGWGLLAALSVWLVVPAALAFEFFVWLPHANRNDPTPQPSTGQLLRAWWRECGVAYAVFGWRQPFRTHSQADHLHTGYRGTRAVILVHGYFCNRALWNPWMQTLRDQKVPFIAVTLEPAFGSIDDYASTVEAAVERAWQATGVAPLLVGHSMGGLVIRAWRRAQQANAGIGAPVSLRFAHAITIGTPHHGTVTAASAHTTNALQMRRESPWLQALAAQESESDCRRFTCYYSACDNIVMPAATATLPGAHNIHLPGWGHVDLINAPSILDEVLQRVTDGRSPSQAKTIALGSQSL
jgi:triacylglycerol lipase